MTKNNRVFHLSVVATSRNDNHGGSLLTRMQHFVDGFIQQCSRHQLSAELILVEWNPPTETSSLAETLRFPDEMNGCVIRIITVPSALHATLKHSDNLLLFQMIAKNVGIRRALGEYVLVTNIDILFSDEIMKYLAAHLKPNKLYRADRFDIPPNIPKTTSFDTILLYCREHAFRINAKFGTLLKIHGKWKSPHADIFMNKIRKKMRAILKMVSIIFHARYPELLFKAAKKISRLAKALTPERVLLHIVKKIQRMKRYISDRFRLHTNACGDFTLLSYQDWCELRGYPEWEIFSWHLDSILLYQANRNGIREVNLHRNLGIYHIEHRSGYTPEEEEKLFNRLDEKKIPYLSIKDFWSLVHEMDAKKRKGEKTIYNSDTWGFSDMAFNEIIFD